MHADQLNNIVDAIGWHASDQPDAMALTFIADSGAAATSLTFAEVNERSRAIACELLDAAPGAQRAMVLQAPGLDFVLSLCACFIAGITAVPTPVPTARANSNAAQRFARLMADAAPDVIVTHSALLARSRWLIERQIGLAAQTWVLSDTSTSSFEAPNWPEIRSNDLAFLQYTSGSTAEPKGVMIDHANLVANLSAIQAKFELNRESVVVSWLPPYHDMGLIGGIISALWCGYHVVLMDPVQFIKRPLCWLETIDRFRADVSGGANFAYDLCVDALARADKPALDLSHWRLAFSGAEPVRASTIERFFEAFAKYGFRPETFYPCYGLAEATLMATGPDPGSPRPRIVETDDARKLVSCGTPCPGLTLEIVDPETGAPLADGAEGEIRITGSSVSRGYWRDDKGAGSDPLATGDLGFIRSGELYVTGRLKDLIIVRGRNVAPADIEDAIAMCHPALAPAAATAFSVDAANEEGFAVAAEIRREHRGSTNWQEVFAAMRSRIAERTGLVPADMVLLRPGKLARTTSGKIRRQTCRDAYLDDGWDPLARSGVPSSASAPDGIGASRRMATASREERWASIHDYLVWRLAQLTATPEVFLTSETGLDTVGLDSLKRVEFTLLAERDLGVSLSGDWFDRAPTLQELARQLLALHGGAAEPDTENRQTDAVRADAHVPLSPRQRAFLDGMPTHPEQFAEVLYFRTPKGASADNLKRAIAETIGFYDAFSLRFEHDETDWRAWESCEHSAPAFKFIDVSRMDKSETAKTRSDVLRYILDGISLDEGVLVSAVLMERGNTQPGLLAVGFHHLVIDAISLSAWAVRFQHAYAGIANQEVTCSGPPTNEYVPWLRALDAYGRSSELTGELEYWKKTCGTTDEAPPTNSPGRTSAWTSIGKATLALAANQRLLERYRAPVERNGAVLAALSRAWADSSGDRSPLVMTENHGRFPFPGTDPSTTVGWFAARHPVCVPVRKGADTAALVHDAIAHLRAVPKLGHGYGLLRRKDPDSQLRREMEQLRKPGAFLQYRGNVDDTFRTDAALPVIAVHHEGRAFDEASRNLGDVQPFAVIAGLSDGVLYWSIFHTLTIAESMAHDISERMRLFLSELAEQ